MIPAADVYNEFRELCFCFGAVLTAEARGMELEAGADPLTKTRASRATVVLCRSMLRQRPSDPDGWIREVLAGALLSDAEFKEARALADDIAKLRGDSPDFAYLYAQILSRSGEAKLALHWLRRAIDLGYLDIESIRNDPAMVHLCTTMPQEFADTIRLKYTWDVVFGLFNDDVRLRNDSRYPLTNVAFDVRIEQDSRQWNLSLTADVIQPGETYTWRNVVSIPKSRITNRRGVVRCDQSTEHP